MSKKRRISAAKTDPGLKRGHNEDAIAIDERGIYILADGMGGHAAGDVASRMLADTVMENLSVNYKENLKEKKAAEFIKNAIADANMKIFTLSASSPEKKGMGATAVVLMLLKKKYIAAWAGDSRLYLYREKKLTRLTKDHSRVQELIDAGIVKEENAMDHPDRNIITRAVGNTDQAEIEILSGKIRKNDIYLLCSDGIHGEISEAEIEKVLRSSEHPEKICEKLIETANLHGGSDNSSVIAIKILR